jgi:hypothetical protein
LRQQTNNFLSPAQINKGEMTMNRDKQPRRPALRVYLPAAFALMILFGLSDAALAQNQWSTASNGTDIYNTNAGKVGIGTSNPSFTLHVVGNADTIVFPGMPFNAVFASNNTAAAGIGAGISFGGSYTGTTQTTFSIISGVKENATDGNYAGALLFSTRAYGGTVTEKMRITSTGNVGIGTTTPAFDANNSKFVAIDNGSGGWSEFGIGSNTPGTFTNLGMLAFFNSNRTTTEKRNAVITGRTDGATNSGALEFYTTNAGTFGRQLTIDRYGNVMIGSGLPAYKLDVTGQIHSSSGGFVFPDGTVQTTAGGGGTITGVTAGAGLTGGGTSGAVTLNVGAGTGLSVAADSVEVNYGSTAGTAVQGNTSVTVSAGTGMSGGGSLTLGAGGSVTLNNADPGSSQPIFKNIADAAGATQFSAGSNSDSLRFEGTGGTSVSFDAAAKKVIINSPTSGPTLSAANVSAGQFGQNTGGGDFSFPANVTVAGNIAAKYQDVAEWVPSRQKLAAGTVVVLDTEQPNQVTASTRAYDTTVAGVVSAQPGVILGTAGENKAMVATTGRVKVKVDATRAPIRVGDLLVTSEQEGVAMKSEPLDLGGTPIHRPGTLIGKALEPLEKGTGEILVLLSLQ